MKQVKPEEDFEEEGFLSAVELTADEIEYLYKNKFLEKVLAFADSVSAIINQGAGDLILIQIPNGEQYTFSVRTLANDLDEFI